MIRGLLAELQGVIAENKKRHCETDKCDREIK
jgi:hypothetical protein